MIVWKQRAPQTWMSFTTEQEIVVFNINNNSYFIFYAVNLKAAIFAAAIKTDMENNLSQPTQL